MDSIEKKLANRAKCNSCGYEAQFSDFLPVGTKYRSLSKKTKIVCPKCQTLLKVSSSNKEAFWGALFGISAFVGIFAYIKSATTILVISLICAFITAICMNLIEKKEGIHLIKKTKV